MVEQVTETVWDVIVNHAASHGGVEHLIHGGDDRYYCSTCRWVFYVEEGVAVADQVPD